ncbi:MAG: hypothetical protein HKN11_09380 [Rhizobiales bacterium]|nr:hypothetical protein [Hyphomicrobiales bacterium]
MNRRALIAGLITLASTRAAAHTPYGQWVVYRKKHLLIGAHRAEPATYEVAQKLVAVLARHLPKARSRIARAPTAGRLASLIGTDQLDVAVLSQADAIGMLTGRGEFSAYGQIPITVLARLETHLLVAHERFPARHARLVAAALHAGGMMKDRSQTTGVEIPWHPGSLIKTPSRS